MLTLIAHPGVNKTSTRARWESHLGTFLTIASEESWLADFCGFTSLVLTRVIFDIRKKQKKMLHMLIVINFFYIPLALAQTITPVDYSCGAHSDCAIKNVGNCCGYYPKCVNKDFTPGVSCLNSTGMVGVCGYPDINSCFCQDGQCKGNTATGNIGDDGLMLFLTCLVLVLTTLPSWWWKLLRHYDCHADDNIMSDNLSGMLRSDVYFFVKTCLQTVWMISPGTHVNEYWKHNDNYWNKMHLWSRCEAISSNLWSRIS